MNIPIFLIMGYFCLILPIFSFIAYNVIRFIHEFLGLGTWSNPALDFIINPIVVGLLWWCGAVMVFKSKIGAGWWVILLLGVVTVGMGYFLYSQVIPRLMLVVSILSP